MKKDIVIQKVSDLLSKPTLSKVDKVDIVKSIKCMENIKVSTPTKVKIGDVFMHKIFQHPCVLLQKNDDGWLCGLLTTESTCDEILEPCKSRFFSENYITKTLFIVNNYTNLQFLSVYDNNKQLRDVLKKLLVLFIK